MLYVLVLRTGKAGRERTQADCICRNIGALFNGTAASKVEPTYLSLWKMISGCGMSLLNSHEYGFVSPIHHMPYAVAHRRKIKFPSRQNKKNWQMQSKMYYIQNIILYFLIKHTKPSDQFILNFYCM